MHNQTLSTNPKKQAFHSKLVKGTKLLLFLSPRIFAPILGRMIAAVYPDQFEYPVCGVCENHSFSVAQVGRKRLPGSLYTGSPEFSFFAKELFPLIYRKCRHCGMGRISPSPKREWINWIPPQNSVEGMADWMEDPGYISDKQSSLESHFRLMDLGRFKSDEGSVLDVSCGAGVGLEYFRDRFGWKTAVGVECDRQAVQIAKQKRRLNVHPGFITDLSLDEKFDLVIFDNSLEHHSSPKAALLKARSLLRKGGAIFIVVPNYHGWEIEEQGLKNSNMNWGHWHYFTVYSLRKLFEATGFEIAKAFSHSEDGYVERMKKQGKIVGTIELEREGLLKLGPGEKYFPGNFIQVLGVAV